MANKNSFLNIPMNYISIRIKILIFISFLFINLNTNLKAHMRGYFSTKEEAIKESLAIGCRGAHKNKNKWLPCKDEKELHKYLNK